MRKAIQFSWQFTGMLLAVLWLFQTPLWAAIYKWRDDQGKLHFTDSKSKIPLKYRDQVKKFKGVTESKPKEKKPEPVQANKKEKEAVVSESAAGEEKAAGGKAGGEEKNPELVAMLKEALKFLEDKNRAQNRILNVVEPTEANGKYYMMSAQKSIPQKKAFAKKLSEFDHPALKKARLLLKNSAAKDSLETIGGDGYLERIKSIHARFKREIKKKEKVIKAIKEELDKK